MNLYDDFFYAKKVNQLFSDREMIGAMLRFEAALAEAQGACGLIPTPSVLAVKNACKASFININRIRKEIKSSGNAAIPLVKALIEVVKKHDADAAKYVHMGATSQDVVDTAMVLQWQKSIDFFEKTLKKLQKALIQLAKTHRDTVMIGRTLMQQARPITFGLKAAYWLEAIDRSVERLQAAKTRVLTLQLGGAVGSLAGMNGQGLAVAEKMAALLQLRPQAGATHTQRDNFAEIAAVLGILTGSLGKIAKDIVLLMQTEVAEVFEGAAEGKGGSSTMPHKRNPVTATAILANAHRVPHLVASVLSSMSQEHERSAGLWHSEWETLTDVVQLTAGALENAVDLIQNLEIDTDRMAQNLTLTNGLIFAENASLALAVHLGKGNAHHLVEQACKKAVVEKRPLKDVLRENATAMRHLTPSVLDELFDPHQSVGLSSAIIDRILAGR